MPLSKVIENIQRASFELVEDNRKRRADLEAAMRRFIETADAKECLTTINALVDRVSSITGEAGDLEDAAGALTKHIESENDEPHLCAQCNGSGEGQYDGTRCRGCKGSGTK